MAHSTSKRGIALGLFQTLCIASLALLAACGGGGGGSGGGTDALQIRYDRSTVSLSAQESPSPGAGAQVIQATASGGSASDSLFVGAELQGVGILLPIPVLIDTVARTGTITLTPNTALEPGTYTGTVRLLACKDTLCAAHHQGSPFSMGYTVTITPRFKASSSSLEFAAAESLRPEAQLLRVTLPQGTSSSTAAVEYPAGMTPWLEVTPQGQNYSLQPRAGLAVATHNAVLRLEAGASNLPIRIPVQFRVSSGLVLPSQVDVSITSNSPASAASGEVAITTAAGVGATQWSATSDQPWLRLAAGSGAVGTALRWQLDATAFAALANRATHEAVVTVSAPGTALTAHELRVRLTRDVAELLAADTVAVQAGEAGEVLLYGRGLDQLQQPAARVATSGFTPQQVSLRSASLMSLQVPALPAGEHQISLQTASGLLTRSVRLAVMAAQDRQEIWVNSSGLKGALMWDAANQAAYMMDLDQRAIVRVRPNGSTLEQTMRVLPGLAGIALSPDRASLIATTTGGQLLNLSPDTLSTLRTRDLGRTLSEHWPPNLPLMVTADQLLLATGGEQWTPVLAYDLARDAAATLTGASSYTFYSGPWGLVSRNGQRALVSQTAGLSPSPPLLRRDGVDGRLTAFDASVSTTFFYSGAADRRGTRWLLDALRVVDFDLNTLGLFPVPLAGNWYPQAVAMSRDGSRAYLFAINDLVSDSRIFVFDTSSAVGSINTYPLLGVIQPLLSPSCLSPTQSPGCNGYGSRMVLMDDDRTLVLAGDRRIGIVPVPPALRGGVPVAQPMRAPHTMAVGRR